MKQLFQVIMAVATGPPPTLPDTTAASDAFRAFLAAALIKSPESRPGAAELVIHPFAATAADDALVDLARTQARRPSSKGASTAVR